MVGRTRTNRRVRRWFPRDGVVVVIRGALVVRFVRSRPAGAIVLRDDFAQ